MHIGEKELLEYEQLFRENHKRSMRLILSLYKNNVWLMIKACFFLLLQRSPVWVLPLVISSVINLATTKDENAVSKMLILFGIAAFFLIQNIFTNHVATKGFATVNRKIENKLRNILIRKIQYLSITFHKNSQSGKLQSKIMRDVENVYELLNQIFRVLFFFIIDVTVIVIVCAERSPVVLIFFLITVPVSMFVVMQLRGKVKKSNNELRESVEQTQGAVSQMLEMIPVTRAHGLQEVEIEKMETYFHNIFQSGFRLDVINSFFAACNWVVFQLMQVSCLMFTAYLALTDRINVGDIVLYQTYFTQLIGQISLLINIYPAMCKGMESLRSIGDIIEDSNVEMDSNQNKNKVKELQGSVEFRNVYFKFNDSDKMLIEDFTLEVNQGESVAFVGQSGAGKSTLLNLLIGFFPTTEGQILIDGIDLKELDINKYRNQIAVVPQQSVLFDGSLRENITYGIKKVEDEKILQVLQEVGLEAFLQTLPEGLDTRLGEHGGRLSGGQKQRIAIARALIREPRIIVLDEATSALDSASEKKVQEATERLMGTCTTFIVAHRLSTIKKVNRIVVLKNGKIVEIGTYTELMKKQGEFYEMQQAGEQTGEQTGEQVELG